MVYGDDVNSLLLPYFDIFHPYHGFWGDSMLNDTTIFVNHFNFWQLELFVPKSPLPRRLLQVDLSI